MLFVCRLLFFGTIFGFILGACSSSEPMEQNLPNPAPKDTVVHKDTNVSVEPEKVRLPVNDTLDEIAGILAATSLSSTLFPQITSSSVYQNFQREFAARWKKFDSTRISQLIYFEDSVLAKTVKHYNAVFYPFSGPDYLYAGRFFPKAQHYLMVGLEPIGSLDVLKKEEPDSLSAYFQALNTSLNAILNFSFFRTNSMEEDLRKSDLDGVIHLLLLFLKREGNGILSCKPFELDSLGNKVFFTSFSEQKKSKSRSKGVEIGFVNSDNTAKVLDYFSVNLSDYAIKQNKGFMKFLAVDSSCVTYLKGASYLLHKPHFSRIRQNILSRSNAVVQDDSGIALHYFLSSGRNWTFELYGEYKQPISMFRKLYQASLDSLYRKQGATALGFGIGYNFKDKNSNLMIAIPH